MNTERTFDEMAHAAQFLKTIKAQGWSTPWFSNDSICSSNACEVKTASTGSRYFEVDYWVKQEELGIIDESIYDSIDNTCTVKIRVADHGDAYCNTDISIDPQGYDGDAAARICAKMLANRIAEIRQEVIAEYGQGAIAN